MISPFVVVKEHLIKSIREKQLIDSKGEIRNLDEWVTLINSLPASVWVSRYENDRHEILLLSKSLIEILDLDSEEIDVKDVYTIYMTLDTTFMVNVHNIHADYALGAFSEGGMNALWDCEDGSIHEFNNYSFPLLHKGAYRNVCFHLFCEPEKMRLLQAYFLYDFFDLTVRQREVLDLMVFGKDKEEVSERLGISPRTSEKHFKLILDHAELDTQQEFLNSLII